MNESFQFIDIIFFAVVAAFLVLRLRSVLGRRTGNERPRPDGFGSKGKERIGLDGKPLADDEPVTLGDNVIELPDRRRVLVEDQPAAHAETPVEAGVNQIRQADPSFESRQFIEGAKAAFEVILGAYALGEVKTLKPLLNSDVLRNFQGAIEARITAGETLESELVGIKSADMLEAGLDGRNAVVTVKFISEQVNALRSAAGEVLEGDPTRVTEVVDVWTFSRDTRSRNPNWLLIATATPDD